MPSNFNKLVSRSGVEGEGMGAGESMTLGESTERTSLRNALLRSAPQKTC